MFTFKPLRLEDVRLYPGQASLHASITSVLGILADPIYIRAWKAKVGEREAQRTIDVARARGKYLHAMAENYFNGRIKEAPLTERELKMIVSDDKITNREISFYSGEFIVPDAIPVDEKIKKFAVAFNTFIATHGAGITETYACEEKLVSEELKLAGKPDWVGIADGLITLDDYKTSSSARFNKETRDKYAMQTVLYSAMWNLAHPNKKIQRIRIIPFTNARKAGLGEIEIITDKEEMRHYYQLFMLEILPTFIRLLTNHPGYAECAFKLHSPMSVSTEARESTGPSIVR